ncbi:hypothetical protein AYI69_g9052, partial [Smittium culicis]
MLLGNFNMDIPASKKLALKLVTGVQHAKVTNSTGSRLNSHQNWCNVNRYLDLSDHIPVTEQWTLDALEVPAKKLKINAKKLLLAENNFVSYNRFTVLAETEMGLNELFKGLIDTVWDQSARL